MTPEAEAERKRCAAIAEGLAIALKMGAGTIHSERFREGAVAAAQWIHDEIMERPVNGPRSEAE
jgi:hypothetical protein